MKTLIFSISVFLISAPLIAQTSFSGASAPITTPTSPTTGAPVLGPANTSPVPPTLNRTSPVNNTGFETSGAASGTSTTTTGTGTTFSPDNGLGTGTTFGTGTGTNTVTPTGTGTDFGVGTPSTTPTAPGGTGIGTGTTQPGGSIMNPGGASGTNMGSGWQGR